MASYPSVLRQILRHHGRRALAALAGRLPVAVGEAARDPLERMTRCRTPGEGFVRLRCGTCGHLKTIAFGCGSRLCPSCGWLYAQQFIKRVRARIIQCRYWRPVFSVPRELWQVLFWHREVLPIVCHAAAAATLECFWGLCGRHPLVPGMIATWDTLGRNLRFHVHLSVTEGALQIGGVWQPIACPALTNTADASSTICSRGCGKPSRPTPRSSGPSAVSFASARPASS